MMLPPPSDSRTPTATERRPDQEAASSADRLASQQPGGRSAAAGRTLRAGQRGGADCAEVNGRACPYRPRATG